MSRQVTDLHAACLPPNRPLTLDDGSRLSRLNPGPVPPAPSGLWSRAAFRNQLIVAEMVLCSARKREERRGAHFRDDFPQSDDERWLANVVLWRDQSEGMELILKPVDRK